MVQFQRILNMTRILFLIFVFKIVKCSPETNAASQDKWIRLAQASKLEWCNLNSKTVLLNTTLASTSKRITLMKSQGTSATALEMKHLCRSICGSLYFPSTFSENKEVLIHLEPWLSKRWTMWLRLGYVRWQSAWKDIGGKEILRFANWATDEPKQISGRVPYYAFMDSDGKWHASVDSISQRFEFINRKNFQLCELS